MWIERVRRQQIIALPPDAAEISPPSFPCPTIASPPPPLSPYYDRRLHLVPVSQRLCQSCLLSLSLRHGERSRQRPPVSSAAKSEGRVEVREGGLFSWRLQTASRRPWRGRPWRAFSAGRRGPLSSASVVPLTGDPDSLDPMADRRR